MHTLALTPLVRMTVNPNPHEGELRDIMEQQARNETALQKRLDEGGESGHGW
ncbi:TPA: hypothetical protein ACIVQF_005399 [Salmonella enterica subsp. enterica serovar Muenchen]